MKNVMHMVKNQVSNKSMQSMVLVGVLMALGMGDAIASTTTLPWEGPLNLVMKSLCGNVVKAAAVIAFVVTGLLVAFGEAKGLFSTMLRIAFGLSLALMATQWLMHFGVGGITC